MFGQQKADLFFVVQILHDAENFFDDLWRQTHRRFIEQNHFRLGHQSTTHRTHLLLAARGVASLRLSALLEAGEIVIHHFQILFDLGARHAAGVSPRQKVFFQRQVAETMPALHHLNHTFFDKVGRRHLIDAFALELDTAFGHVAAFGAEQVGDGLQSRRFAGPVGAEQRDDLALGHFERHALEHQNDVIVDHLDIIDRQITPAGRPVRSR